MADPLLTRWQDADGEVHESEIVEDTFELPPGADLLTDGWKRQERRDNRALFQRSGTVRVLVGWDDDRDSPWVTKAQRGDGDCSDQMFEVEVPKELWDAYDAADTAAGEAQRAVFAATGIPIDGPLRLPQCCPSWRGSHSTARNGFKIVLSASGSDDEWPLRDVAVAYGDDRDVLERRIEVLPDPMYLLEHGLLAGPIDRSRLRIDTTNYAGSTSGCHRCGWPRSEHADPGQEDS